MRRSVAYGLLLLAIPSGGAAQPIGSELHVNTYTTGFQTSPAVAEDGSGDFVVVWRNVAAVGSVAIFGQKFDADGTPKGSEFRVSANGPTVFSEDSPSIASAADGTFLVVWTDGAQSDGSDAGVYGRFSRGVGNFQVNSYTTGSQAGGKVACNAVGDAVVVWQSDLQDGDQFGIYAKRVSSLGALSGEFQVNPTGGGDQTFPSVSVSPSGAFMVAWVSSANYSSPGSIKGRVYKSSGAPLTNELSVNAYTTGSHAFPSVTALDTGDFVVVWGSYSAPGHEGIYAQRFEASGAPIGAEFRVNTTTGLSVFAGTVSTAPGGGFTVAWSSDGQDGSGLGVYAQRYDGNADAIGTEFRVNTFTVGWQFAPAVDARSGNLVVAWQSQDESGDPSDGIFAAHQLLTNTDRRVNTFTTGSQSAPAIAADSSGNTVVVWQSAGQDGSGLGVYGQRFDASGTPRGSEIHVSAFVQDDQAHPSVASSSTGAFVVVWQSANQIFNYPISIFGRRYSSAGVSQGSEFLVAEETFRSPRDPSVSSDAAGNFVVAWTDSFRVYGRRFAAAGTPLGSKFLVNDSFSLSSDSALLRPSVASANAGFVVVWASDFFLGPGQARHQISARQYDSSGAALGAPFIFYLNITSDSSHPRAAADLNGDFVVVWQTDQYDGSDYGVFGQRLDAAGAFRGGLFRVNTFTTGRQAQPSVSVDGSGAFVVSWQGVGQDGSEYGVYGQRYDVGGVPQGGEFRVNGFAPASQAAPAVAYANGKITVAFQAGGEGSGYGIYLRNPLCLAGDVDGSGHVDVADVFYLINTLFAGGPATVCSGDVDGSGHADVSDVFYLINFLFAGGPPPK
jgi:hypothetical protein